MKYLKRICFTLAFPPIMFFAAIGAIWHGEFDNYGLKFWEDL